MSTSDLPCLVSRRAMLGTVGKAAASAVALQSVLQVSIYADADAADAAVDRHRLPVAPPVRGVAGVDRVVVLPGKTYMREWAGYGEPPRSERAPPNCS